MYDAGTNRWLKVIAFLLLALTTVVVYALATAQRAKTNLELRIEWLEEVQKGRILRDQAQNEFNHRMLDAYKEIINERTAK